MGSQGLPRIFWLPPINSETGKATDSKGSIGTKAYENFLGKIAVGVVREDRMDRLRDSPLNYTLTLKLWFRVTQGHRKRHYSIEHIRLYIRLLW